MNPRHIEAGPDTDLWVDRFLLDGPAHEACLRLGRPVDRGTLRDLVTVREQELTAAGLRSGDSLALRLPPSLAYVTTLLSAWRIGAQVAILDYRFTEYEAGEAVERLASRFVVEPASPVKGALRGFFDVEALIRPRPEGRPAPTGHALIQLSSGSTGPSKMIGRTAADLTAEIERYTLIEGFPRHGERVVVLASPLHVLGLVGGLLHSLRIGAEVVIPARLTIDSIFSAIADGGAPTTVLGVPSQAEILSNVAQPPPLPQLVRMVTGGEPVHPEVREKFTTRFGAQLGAMYGMTECGVIATDVSGENLPMVTPAPGVGVRVVDGEIQLSLPASPYVGLVDPERWSDGWLRTKDAGEHDPGTGRLRVLGRLDAQVSVGGLKVDLAEVEALLAGLPGVADAVVLFDRGIEAYVSLAEPAADTGAADRLTTQLTDRLAAYKRPRGVHVVPALARTATGKLVRDPGRLRAQARAAASEHTAPNGVGA
ncbi:class I adenylate-forming enzyme family protein [Streptomyces sp. NPDC003011]